MLLAIKPFWKTAALGLLLAPTFSVAQVAINLTLSSAKALLYEEVIATVLIQNNSGQLLTIDPQQETARFWFDVAGADGRIVPRRNDAELLPAAKIMPGEARPFRLNVPLLYAIRREGLYKLRAGLELHGVNYASPEKMLEIVSGFELQRLTSGLPGEGHAPRTYILSYFQKEGIEHIYLRIEDSERTVYGLFNLGRLVRVRPPELKVDEAGNFHVLFQTVGGTFVHTAFTPFGVQLFSKNYAGKRGNASLTLEPNGQIAVLDGIEMKPAATTAEDQAAEDKAKKKTGSGGMPGPFKQPAPER